MQVVARLLILFGPSLVGLGIVALSCLTTRRTSWLVGALIAGVLLHLLSTAIINLPNLGIGEPSQEQFVEAHDHATLYFICGVPFFVVPTLLRIFYVRLHKEST